MELPGWGSICVIPVVRIRCVHYIEQKDCTSVWLGSLQGIYERFPIEKEASRQWTPATQAGLYSVQPRAPLVYFLYDSNPCGPRINRL